MTVVHTVPTRLNGWLAQPPEGVGLRTLRWLFVSGEPLSGSLVQIWRDEFPGSATVVNFYGPTETTMIKCFHAVAGEVQPGAQPAGKPMPQTQALILNALGQLCGIGEPGEVVLRTPFRTLGYINAPEEARSRFVPNPFRDDDESDLLYLTGDRGRYRPDGSIDLMGRLDDQLKIRGVRVEPGEVAAVLAEHPAVQASVVVGQKDEHGTGSLAAYVVARPSQAVTAAELRSFLGGRLPAALVPSTWMFLDDLPRLSNGKVDRSALPSPPLSHADAESVYVAPRTPTEFRLVALWQDVLGVARVGIHDNFFDLGGHSLLAARLFARIEDEFGHALPLATLFEDATVAHLAKTLGRGGSLEDWSSLVPIQPRGSRPPFFCVHGIGGNVLGYKDLARHLPGDQPVYGLQAVGLDGKRAPFTTIEAMAAHFVGEIRLLQPEGPYHLGGLSMGGVVAFETAQQLRALGHQVAVLALFDTWRPGFSKSLPPTTLGRFAFRRIKGHAIDLLPGSGGRAIGAKARTLRRRARSWLWRSGYLAGERIGHPMPRALMAVTEANGLARRRYVPAPYPGRITLFRAHTRSMVPRDDWQMGWGGWAAEGVEVHEVPGDHVTLLLEPHVWVLAERLQACVEAARSSDGMRQQGTAKLGNSAI